MAAFYVLLQRRVRAANLSAGALVAWTLLMWASSLGAPGASYYLTWPLLFAVLPLAWTILARERDRHPGREPGGADDRRGAGGAAWSRGSPTRWSAC